MANKLLLIPVYPTGELFQIKLIDQGGSVKLRFGESTETYPSNASDIQDTGDTLFVAGTLPANMTAVESGSDVILQNTDNGYFDFKDRVKIGFASGFSEGGIAGVLGSDATDHGNVGPGEDILISYNIGDGDLSVVNEMVEATFVVAFAANINSKQVRLRIGNGGGFSVIYDSGAQIQSGGSITIRCWILLINAAASQRCICTGISSGILFADDSQYTDLSEDFGSGLQLRLTGEGVADNDIVHKMSVVKYRAT